MMKINFYNSVKAGLAMMLINAISLLLIDAYYPISLGLGGLIFLFGLAGMIFNVFSYRLGSSSNSSES